MVATDHGPMIVNCRDWEKAGEGMAVGVSVEMFSKTHYDADELGFLCNMLDLRHGHAGDGMLVIDGGANIGAYTLTLAKHLLGRGSVIAVEPQERMFYALAGNVAMNNLFNVKCINAAITSHSFGGSIAVPDLDYTQLRNYGGVTLSGERRTVAENKNFYWVPTMIIDSLKLERLDLLKLDIEGMEPDALIGARETLARCRPIVWAEHICCGEEVLTKQLTPRGYEVHAVGMNVIAFHHSDPMTKQVTFREAA